jgi:hypothetical protein
MKVVVMRSIIRNFVLLASSSPALVLAFNPVALSANWNLVGNSDLASIDVPARFSDASKIYTVWKWDKVNNRWAFYAPSMTPEALAAYATAKNYALLTSIESKEGYWVNAAMPTTINDTLAPPPATDLSTTLAPSDLVQGWNLMSSGDKKTPSQLNSSLKTSLNAASKGISTVWAWDVVSSSWKFYAPSLEAKGGTVLSSYINSKNYLPFSAALGTTEGFWVNIAAETPQTTLPSPSAWLKVLNYTSAEEWGLRIVSSSSAQNTPAADGSTRYRHMGLKKAVGGSPWAGGGFGGPAVYWSGADWSTLCPINFESTESATDAQGRKTFNTCNNFETGSNLGDVNVEIDISGRSMLDVYNEIRAGANPSMNIAAASTVLAGATYPVGSVLEHQTWGTDYTDAIQYWPGSSNFVPLFDAGQASGDPTACTAYTPGSPSPSLESLIAANKGTPCVLPAATEVGANGVTLSSGPRNENWNYTTLPLGRIGNQSPNGPANASSWYTTNTLLRVGFGSGNAVNYYSCQEDFYWQPRNCDLIGYGTYSIQTMGDGRVLGFAGYPALTTALYSKRFFVERGGHVFGANQYLPMPGDGAMRLNLTALNALFTTLGIPTFDPATPITLSVGSYSGTYNSTFSGADTGTIAATVNPNGSYSCSGFSNSSGTFPCSFSLTLSGVYGTIATASIVNATTGAQFSGTLDYYTGAVAGNWSVNGSMAGSFSGLRQ